MTAIFQETDDLLIIIKPQKLTGYLHAHCIMN